MNNPLLYLLVFIVAMLYSSAGFGGASGYLLAMNFFDIPANVMSSTALVLNIFVSSRYCSEPTDRNVLKAEVLK